MLELLLRCGFVCFGLTRYRQRVDGALRGGRATDTAGERPTAAQVADGD